MSLNILADGTHSLSTMRGMGLPLVNPLQVNSMGGQDSDLPDEFVVNRVSSSKLNRLDKTSGG